MHWSIHVNVHGRIKGICTLYCFKPNREKTRIMFISTSIMFCLEWFCQSQSLYHIYVAGGGVCFCNYSGRTKLLYLQCKLSLGQCTDAKRLPCEFYTCKLITNKLKKMGKGLTSEGSPCTHLKVKSPASHFLWSQQLHQSRLFPLSYFFTFSACI